MCSLLERVLFATHSHTHTYSELGFRSQDIPNCQQGEKRRGRVVLLIDQEEEREHNRPFKSWCTRRVDTFLPPSLLQIPWNSPFFPDNHWLRHQWVGIPKYYNRGGKQTFHNLDRPLQIGLLQSGPDSQSVANNSCAILYISHAFCLNNVSVPIVWVWCPICSSLARFNKKALMECDVHFCVVHDLWWPL